MYDYRVGDYVELIEPLYIENLGRVFKIYGINSIQDGDTFLYLSENYREDLGSPYTVVRRVDFPTVELLDV